MVVLIIDSKVIEIFLQVDQTVLVVAPAVAAAVTIAIVAVVEALTMFLINIASGFSVTTNLSISTKHSLWRMRTL